MAASFNRAVAGSSRSVTAALTSTGRRIGAAQRFYATPAAQIPSASTDPNWELPEIHLGATHANRYAEHYEETLASDLMYMSYNHRESIKPPRPPRVPAPMTAYELNRPQPTQRGNKPFAPATTLITPETVPELESIVLHTMVKEAIGNKQALLSAIMAFRAISGETQNGGGRAGSKGVEVVISRSGAAAFKLRAGMPVAVKVELRGQPMYDFIQCFVDFVLPRIREFPGFALPFASASKSSSSMVSGVVSMGLPAAAMGLFPQIEANLDSYPRMHGFHMHFITNSKGERAEDNARSLLSGFRIPFYRR